MEPKEQIIADFEAGKNILLTGGAGVGKSYNLRHFVEWADNENLNMARTALTGMASLQLPMGETLHRCTGIGFAKNLDDLNQVTKSYKFRNEIRWELQALDALIIDEISMLRSDTLELIDGVLKYARNNDEPFGGLQTVFSGDFMQLPPVVKNEEKPFFNERGFWAFQSPVFNELDFSIRYLTEIKRQDNPKFATALNMIRAGAINQAVNEYFRNTENHNFPDDVEPVRLLGTNFEVNKLNEAKLKKLDTKLETYDANITAVNDKLKDRIIRDCPAMETLNLKEGAQVMILVNDKTNRYVNGSMGEYLGLAKKEILVMDEWVKTEVCLVRLFSSDEIVELPRYEWKIEKKKEVRGKFSTQKLAGFCQFPIKLGWAITIHKSQGMSLDYLQVDLTRCFAEGMAYVALSRARTYEGLKIVNWRPGIVNCNKDAFNFYMELKNKGEI